MRSERHRHRYEFNIDYREFEDAGMVFAGTSPDDRLMEIIELPENDFFVAAQYCQNSCHVHTVRNLCTVPLLRLLWTRRKQFS